MNPEKPLLVYDGDCGFCRRHAERWRLLAGGAVDLAPYQEVLSRFPQISPQKFRESVQLVSPDGAVACGAEAVFKVLAHHPRKAWLLGLHRHFPPFRWVSETVYRWVARHRMLASRLDGLLVGHEAPPAASFYTARFLFLKSLALIYLAAFASLHVQVLGLAGSRGILPAAELLAAAHARFGARAFWEWPSVVWFWPADGGLRFFSAAGVVLAAAAFLGVWPRLVFFLNWFLYLSFASVLRDFFHFQWEALLLEAGFLAVFFAPRGFWAGFRLTGPRPSEALRWLLAWLLFRLMFMSGAVKLLSGDPVWRNLTALRYHFETQPLPTVIAWYAHQMPLWFHRLSCGIMFGIELGAPFLIFAPRRVRHLGALAIMSLQIFILITGNYCFFNALTIALCLVVFDDAFWAGVFRSNRIAGAVREAEERFRASGGRAGAFGRLGTAFLLAVLVPLSILVTGVRAGAWEWPPAALRLYQRIEPFHLASVYGLFADMTTERFEISIEGSFDGNAWEEYRFPFKPQDPHRAPRWVAPHQPRLDWQMWFAALGTFQQNPWFVRLAYRLLEGSPDVLALFEKGPFHQKPPRELRAVLYRYRMSRHEERRRTGAWWVRERVGLYLPPVRLEDFTVRSLE